MVLSRCLAAGLIVAVLTTGCGNGDGDGAAPSSITGPVVAVESEGLGKVTSFQVQSEGTRYDIYIADDVDYGFPLDHLNEHRATADPVVVEVEERDGKLYALSIEDAGG